VGFGVITENVHDDSVIGPESATIGTILKQNGYATSWFGKNHNTPSYQLSSAGPFDQWPLKRLLCQRRPADAEPCQ
jgi:arylsulfatase A-like enzyme